MTADPLTLVHRAYEAWNREDVEAGLALMADDVEWHPPPDSPFGGVHRGHAQVRRFFASVLELFDELRREPVGLEERGPYVLVDVRSHVRGRGSGVGVEVQLTDVFEIRDGLVQRYAVFPDRDQALAWIHEHAPSAVPSP